MDVNGAPPSGGSTFKNMISKEDFAALLAQSKLGDTPSSNSSRAAVLNAESWLKDSSSGSGRFIALPLSMILLRKSKAKLSLNELLVLAYIHGFQRRDPLKGCRFVASLPPQANGGRAPSPNAPWRAQSPQRPQPSTHRTPNGNQTRTHPDGLQRNWSRPRPSPRSSAHTGYATPP